MKFEPSKIQSYREVVSALELATTDFPTLTETTGECGVEWSMERAWRSAGGDVLESFPETRPMFEKRK